MPVVIAGIGVIFTWKTKCIQLRLLPLAIRTLLDGFKEDSSDKAISPLKATFTALAATVGTGNLAGVAGAIAIGGPGTIFWMWISGILGMIIKFSEVIIALHFRKRNKHGQWQGGPMENILFGMPRKYSFLAYLYAFFGMVASFGIGNAAQINTITGSFESLLAFLGHEQTTSSKWILGILLAIFYLYTVSAGIGRIGKYAQVLVPVSAVSYILLAVIALFMNFDAIPFALQRILDGAFRPAAITGGMVGSTFQTIRTGISRGIFTNEAGMGTASIAHASAESEDTVKQGLLGIAEVFIDTIVICTLTALVILCGNVEIPFGTDHGIQLTLQAFSDIYRDWILIPLTIIIIMLATATVLGWGMYGVRCAQFLLGNSNHRLFMLMHCAVIIFSALGNTAVIWNLSEMANGLMAIPNLVCISYLSPVFLDRIKTYRSP